MIGLNDLATPAFHCLGTGLFSLGKHFWGLLGGLVSPHSKDSGFEISIMPKGRSAGPACLYDSELNH
jgi:hypothetical protein